MLSLSLRRGFMAITPPKTINDLILEAYIFAVVISPEEYLSGSQMQLGLDFLNETIAQWSGSGSLIYATNTISFNLTPNQSVYQLGRFTGADIVTDKLVEVFDAYIQIEYARYPLTVIDHDEAYGITRYVNSPTIPSALYVQGTNIGSELTFFNPPDKAYSTTIRAQQEIQSFSLGEEITNIPRHFHKLLRYVLARELAWFHANDTWKPEKEKELDNLLNDARSSSDADYSLNVSSALVKRRGVYRPYSIITG